MIWPARVISVKPMIAASEVRLDELHHEAHGRRQRDLEGLRQHDVAHRGRVVQAQRPGRFPLARGIASMQPRQISPRKAWLEHQRNGGRDPRIDVEPSTVAPKKTRNSCISSGVPWNTWMNRPPREETARFASETRDSAIRAADGAADEGDQRQRSVHGPPSRMNRNSLVPN